MKKEKENFWQRIKAYKILVIALIVLMLAMTVCFPYMLVRIKAKEILKNAKSVRLATQITYYDYYAFNDDFFELDGTRIKSYIVNEIMKLAQCDGEITQVRFNKDSFRVSHLIYVEDGYIVEFNDTGDNPQWTVYKLNKLID